MTEHSYVVACQVEEEVLGGFVADRGFENFLPVSNGEPLVTFIRIGRPEETPVCCHAFGVAIDKIRQEEVRRRHGC